MKNIISEGEASERETLRERKGINLVNEKEATFPLRGIKLPIFRKWVPQSSPFREARNFLLPKQEGSELPHVARNFQLCSDHPVLEREGFLN
jgi:hypothetical protein